jgi:hypothetical protein
VVVVYDYSANVAVEVILNEQGEWLGTTEEHYQPPPVQAEIDRAIDLARTDDRLASRVGGLIANAIPFSGTSPQLSSGRLLEVVFACRSRRLPEYRAWVDLSTESVLYAGSTCECSDHEQEVRS